MSILILPQPFHPLAHDQRAVTHDVDLLTVVPALRVLVAVPLDGDVPVHEHDLDVTGPLLELVVDRVDLVLGHVGVDVQVLVVLLFELLVEAVRDHLVVTILTRQQLTRVIVPETVPVLHVHTATTRLDDFRDKIFGVQVWGLDEDGPLGVAEGRRKRFVLRSMQRALARLATRLPAHHGHGDGVVPGKGNKRRHGIGGGDVWRAGLGVLLDGRVQEASDGIYAPFTLPRMHASCGTQDFRFYVWVVVRITGCMHWHPCL